jgi:hypothetical protein
MDNGDQAGRIGAIVMKNDGMTTILNWVLAGSLLLSLFLCFQFFNQTREARLLQGQVAAYQNSSVFLNLLVKDAQDYSTRNPEINPILESIGAKPKVAPAAATKSANK